MDCKVACAHVDAYVDRELEPTAALELDQHFASCTECACELDVRKLLKGALAQSRTPDAPPGLHSRLVRALDRADGTSAANGRRRWAGVLSIAASLLLAGSWIVGGESSGKPGFDKQAGLVDADELPVEMLRDIVARHTDPSPADITPDRPEQLTAWSRDRGLAFRVRSVEWSEPSVRLLGARISHVGDRQAVKLYYGVGDSRLTTVVFRATPVLHQVLVDEHEGQRLGVRRERIGQRTLSYRNVNGYTVPLIEHDGVVYAFTGDLGQRQLLQLVASARLP